MIGIPFSPYQFLEKVAPNINVILVGFGDRALRKLHRTLIVLKHWHSRHADIRQHETLSLPRNQYSLIDICKHHVLSLHRRRYDAFLCPRNQNTQAPLHMTNPPDTDLLPAALLAGTASANTCKLSPPNIPL